MSGSAPGAVTGAEGLLAVLLARWEARAWLQDALEAEARARLAGAVTDDELETFLEQQVATEQAEFVAEFFWALHAKGCEAPGRMAEWIDSHNALVGRLLDRRNAPLGPRHKRRLWRLKAARFGAKAKAACCARLDGSGVVLSLSDIERFMALHMDLSLCRDRLDALARAGLLEVRRGPTSGCSGRRSGSRPSSPPGSGSCASACWRPVTVPRDLSQGSTRKNIGLWNSPQRERRPCDHHAVVRTISGQGRRP